MSAAARPRERSECAAQRRCPPALTGGEIPAEEAGRGGRPFESSQTRQTLAGSATNDRTAHVDWLSVTFAPEPGELIDRNVCAWLLPLLGGAGGESVNGFHQYENGLRFWHVQDGTAINLGRLDWGGERRKGKARLELTGHGCAKVVDWDLLRAQLEQLSEVTLTRVDLAVDVLRGEYSVDDAVEWYQAGEFRTGAAGRNPRHSTVGDWLDPLHPHGRTLEVGRRENGKMLRAYEKGRQLGDSLSPWVRFEVELRNNDRDLPLDMLTDCERYFVGAYECLQRLIPVAGERIKTHQKEGEIALEVMTEYARTGYGQVLSVLRAVGLSAAEVIDAVSRPGIPKRLERASLGGFINGGRSPTH
jgi:phage replication initiation protein